MIGLQLFLLAAAVFGGYTAPAYAATVSALIPGALAVYYGMPSKVNGAQSVSEAVAVFSQYDAVVFGDSLEFPQYTAAYGQVPYYGCDQNSHFDHDNTVKIIRQLRSQGIPVYGYVSIGGENTARRCPPSYLPTPLRMTEIKARTDAWAAMRVTGIFLDEAEYGFGCSRQRQTEAIDYVHSRGLRAFINSYNPDDVFSNTVVGKVTYSSGAVSTEAMNPSGLGTHLGRRDFYLLEHFQVINGSYRDGADDAAEWARAARASRYSDRYGTLIATIPTAGPAFDQSTFNYGWWTSLLYGFDYVGWGEPYFSAGDNALPHRIRPNPGQIGDFYTSSVIAKPPLYSRWTTRGTIVVDAVNHVGSFAPR